MIIHVCERGGVTVTTGFDIAMEGKTVLKKKNKKFRRDRLFDVGRECKSVGLRGDFDRYI